jgi:hypothetical protein
MIKILIANVHTQKTRNQSPVFSSENGMEPSKKTSWKPGAWNGVFEGDVYVASGLIFFPFYMSERTAASSCFLGPFLAWMPPL